ncbi:MAG: valine--pyruvate aminotransferase [Gammaproteobacteria bacterium]|jgi:valine--pyruvate aminotransferase
MAKYSKFGDQFNSDSGTRQLMDDLGEVLNSGRAMMNLGGGNPGTVPGISELFHDQMQASLDDGRFGSIAGQYDGPQGHRPFLDALAGLLRRRFGWAVDASNIATTAGSQASFFILFNMLAGMTRQGHARHILLPLTPEYIGYAEVGLQADMVRSVRPSIDIIDEHTFKYRIDFEALKITPDVAAVCVSRPTNPTGNVITDDELGQLLTLTREHNVPLIIDNAYGLPFPNIVFSEAAPVFEAHTILCMSLSKLGLPGLRTGIIVAAPEIVQTITSVNAITMLANGSLGASLVTDLIKSDRIEHLCAEEIKPFYLEKALQARAWCTEYFAGINYYLHKTEGAIFLWAWFPDLPISDVELYERLKRRDVLVLAGRHFFPGLGQDWEHIEQCIRISYAQDSESVRRGIEVIGEELRRAFEK